MKNNAGKLIATLMVFFIVLSLAVSVMPNDAAAYNPPVAAVRVGLTYGSSAVVFASVSNVSGKGSGFEFGYYDTKNAFVPIGAMTDDTALTVIIDKNIYYDSASSSYLQIGSAEITDDIIGCYHIQLNNAYTDYTEAKTAADAYAGYGAFVKYMPGGFYVCIGDYRSSADARSALTDIGITDGYTITSGTAYTTTVVKTGTTEIIFEFDCGTDNHLGVKAIYPDGDSLTKYKSYRYYGSFMFRRVDGGNITVINVVDVDNYVRCSVPYESYPSWPVDALKAQAICARNYVMCHLNDHKSKGFDVCNTSCCQVYHGDDRCSKNSNQAVDETKGQYLFCNGKLCDTYYTNTNGGASESACNVWGSSMTTYSYLKGKLDPYETAIADTISGYYYTKTYTGAELTSLMKSEGYNCSDIVSCAVTKFTDVGNVYEVTLTDSNGRKFTFVRNKGKSLLGAKSQRFNITDNSEEMKKNLYVDDDGRIDPSLDGVYAIGDGSVVDKIAGGDIYFVSGSGTGKLQVGDIDYSAVVYTISGSGSGHNVGMSQFGAYAMANKFGKNYEEILAFYFDGSVVVTAE